ncbi:transposable element Tcb1 transposase [Trichonephila clavipes]|nr:transposable element Tcb1 transposase [Trichonephila clavipes]
MWVAEWNKVVFSDESLISLQHHVGRVRVWRHRGGRMLNRCVMHRYNAPASGIMVFGGIGYHSPTTLVRIAEFDPHYTPAATPDQLWQRVKAAWSAVPPKHIQSPFELIPRRVAAVNSKNVGYSGY